MKKETEIKTLRLKSEAVEKINQLAQENNRSFSNMVETILLKFKPDDYPTLI
jgi:predicted transcriptional regulator